MKGRQEEEPDRLTAKSEIEVLKTANNDPIIKYFGYYWDEMKICIILEYADKGSMEKFVLDDGQPMEEYNAWGCVSHISSALACLPAMRPRSILHRDLKPDNILGATVWCQSENGYRISWKLADFGIAKLLTKETQQAYCDQEVRPQEVHRWNGWIGVG